MARSMSGCCVTARLFAPAMRALSWYLDGIGFVFLGLEANDGVLTCIERVGDLPRRHDACGWLSPEQCITRALLSAMSIVRGQENVLFIIEEKKRFCAFLSGICQYRPFARCGNTNEFSALRGNTDQPTTTPNSLRFMTQPEY